MATPTQQGGLNQVSKQPVPQAGNKFDAGAAQAENLVEVSTRHTRGHVMPAADSVTGT